MSRYTTHGLASGSGSGGLPRESVYPGAVPPSDHLGHLEDCISATEGCVSTLSGCLTRLQPGIADLPRLFRVLANKHRFLVIPNTTVHAHMTHMSASLKPEIDALITRAEDLVEHEKDRVAALEKRLAIMQSATLPDASSSSSALDTAQEQEQEPGQAEDETQDLECKLDDIDMRSLSVLQRRKVMLLRNKREKLEKERAKYGLGLGLGVEEGEAEGGM